MDRSPDYLGEQYREFWRAAAGDDRSSAQLGRTTKGWTYLARSALGLTVTAEASTAVAAVSGLVLAIVVGSAARRRGTGPIPHAHALSVALLWMVLFGPATEMNTYSVLAPLGWMPALPGQSSWRRGASGLGVGLLLAAVLRGVFPADPDSSLASLQPIGVLVLFAKTLHALVMPSRPPELTPG